MIDFVVGAIVVAIVGAALVYIIHSGKNGQCIGCPDAKTCSSAKHAKASSSCGGSCGSCGGCGSHADRS